MNPNFGIAQGIVFHIIRLTVMVGVLVAWYQIVGSAQTWQKVVGVALAFIAGHVVAILIRRFLRGRRGETRPH